MMHGKRSPDERSDIRDDTQLARSVPHVASLMRATCSACPGSKHPGHCAHEDDEAEDEAIDHERPTGEAFEHAHQAPDRHECRNGSNHEADDQHRPGVMIEIEMVQFPQFLEPGQGDRGQTQQEREARRFIPLEAERKRRGQG